MSEKPVALVTGAGSGIGRESALLLAEAGYRVALAGRTRSKLEQTARGLGANALVLELDLCADAAAGQAVERTVSHFGRLDALANIAGRAQVCPIPDITADEIHATLTTNLTSVMLLTAAVWSVFKRQKRGVIVNVSSMASIDPFPGFGIYAPTKAALNMFTLITAREGAEIGVRAVTIAPGAVETPMLRAFFDTRSLPTDRTLSPRAVAQVVRDCVTGQRRFEPGQVVRMPSP